MAYKDEVGRAGEQLAAQWVVDQGWELLARNWRVARGEIDLIAREGDTVVAIEVKTRTSATFGGALAAVTPPKVARLRRLFGHWLAEQTVRTGEVRIDVIAVTLAPGRIPEVTHLRGVA
ncbi:YraN family protein [Serinibacter salmoneus]|uniref:UPF0102 protein ATL40_0872 n=1 Tax=Serinibacter salmoneus TaxID=556530 RepID=A0A2A9CY36_9MICO|nr:YraN family protein [Serinibacter salmoneus]PFG19313.1 putative endonuclease [Serinibacter salmoneus]